MFMRLSPTLLALASLLVAVPAAASDPIRDPVGFGAGQSIPATLTLNYSESGRDARMTPIFSKYRPKLDFSGQEVTCMIHLEGGIRTIAPGESGEVRLQCKDAVTIARASARATIHEGGKKVGHVDVRLDPPAE